MDVEFRQIRKDFGTGARKTPVISELNLKVKAGELMVLVGPSGCGKSTLLRILAGLETPTSGQVLIGGRDVTGLKPSERGVAMVFQDYALYPHMSVYENLAFGLKMQKTPAAEVHRKITALCETLELTPLLQRKPAELSGGQRQRVAIGRAMVKDPQVFLLDEPLSNLDAQLRSQMRLEILALHRRLGNTMIYVTHDQEEAMTLADQITVLRKGSIEQTATPRDIYLRPGNQFVAGFMGRPAMNFLEGVVVSDRDPSHSLFQITGSGQFLRVPAGSGPAREGAYSLGIRPEDLAYSSEASHLSARFDFLESQGHQHLVIAELDGRRITLLFTESYTGSSTEGFTGKSSSGAGAPDCYEVFSKMKPGEPFFVRINLEHLHWFPQQRHTDSRERHNDSRERETDSREGNGAEVVL